MIRRIAVAGIAALVVWCTANAEEQFRWTGIDRIVAIGDLHGDWDHYIETLRLAGLVDRRGRWAGGGTHLVQTGDVPDRGPDTRRIIEHMVRLSKQAERAGGRVHNLIGNHEAMNVYGDLRYVSDGEFEAFETRRSGVLRDRYYRAWLARLESEDPERYAALPDDFRTRWNEEHPPGWLEHRFAWSPAWGGDATLHAWVMDAKVAVQLNDTLFVHGGLSGFYCRDSLRSLTETARDELRTGDAERLDLVTDPFGPLWYRGLSGVSPEADPEAVAALLERHGARRIAVGHTPTGGIIWPRYDGRVLQIDTGISAAYGGRLGFLEITEDGAFAGYRSGTVRLPEDPGELEDYVGAVVSLHPGQVELEQRARELLAATQPATDEVADETSPPAGTDSAASDPVRVPICGTRR